MLSTAAVVVTGVLAIPTWASAATRQNATAPLAKKHKCTDIFNGPGTSWGTATNWSKGYVPGPTDYACLKRKNAPTVTDASGTILGLDFTNKAGLENKTGTGSVLELVGAVPSVITNYQQGNEALSIHNAAGTLELQGKTTAISGGIGGPGTLTIPAHQTANISPSWSYNGPDGLTAGVMIVNNGTLETDGGCIGYVPDPSYGPSANETIENQGLLEFVAGSSVWGPCANYDGTTTSVVNETDGTITSLSHSAGFGKTGYVFDNEGSVSVTGAAANSGCFPGTNGCFYVPCSASGCPTSPPSQSGNYSVGTGATIEFEGSRTLASTVTTSGTGTYYVDCGSGTGPLNTNGQAFSSLSVAGTIVGPWTASTLNVVASCNGGELDPLTGTDTFSSPYVAFGSATGGTVFATTIAGSSTFGNLQGSSTATLNGSVLDITTQAGFTPTLNEPFEILNATGGVSGNFGPVIGNCLPTPGATNSGYDVNVNPTNVTLTFVSSAAGC